MQTPRMPQSVLEQVEGSTIYDFSSWPINQMRQFNGTITQHNGKKYMAVRYFGEDNRRCKIAISELDDDLKPVKTVSPTPFEYTNKCHMEDPRLFVHNNKLWMIYAHIYSYKRGGNYNASQILVRFDDNLKVDRCFRPPIGNNENNGVEKNWSPISKDGKLYIIYNIKNNHVFEIDDNTGDIISELKGESFLWPYGSFSGGTPPIRTPMGLLGMQHGFVHAADQRVYNASFYLLEDEYPFKLKEVSYRPDLLGSAVDGFKQDNMMGSWHPRCVFPGGMIQTDDGVLVACGVNDSYTYLLPFKWEHIKTKPIDEFYGDAEQYYFTREQTLIPEYVPRQIVRDFHYPFGEHNKRMEIFNNDKRFVCKTTDVSAKAKILAAYPQVQEITKEQYEEYTAL